MSVANSPSNFSSPLVTEVAMALSTAEPIVITRKEDGKELERVDLVRFAGHYRADQVDAFVVRDADGRLKVRSEHDLGLSPTSPKIAYRAADFGYTPPAA